MLGPCGPHMTPLPPARPGSPWLGLARPGLARPGDGLARLGLARPGRARLSLARLGPARLGPARPGGQPRNRQNISPRHGGGAPVDFPAGSIPSVPSLLVICLQAARPCSPPPPVHPKPCGFHVGANIPCWGHVAPTWPHFHRRGLARLGSARLGPDWSGLERPGLARLGSALLGPARLGSSWLGSARPGSARPGPEASHQIGKIFPPPRGQTSAHEIPPYICMSSDIPCKTNTLAYVLTL